MADENRRAYRLEVISPERVLFDTQATAISLMTEGGSIGVLYGHAPLVAPVVPSVMTVDAPGQPRQSLAVGEGFLEVSDHHVRVLVDSAERPGEIDVERARRAKERAEARLARRGLPDVDYARAEAALRRAVARLRTAGSR